MPDALPPTMPQPGEQIAGKYRVEGVLGAGGMGCVLAAEHTVLRSRVAIKLLLPQAAAIPGATERFLREAQAVAALRSEHVAHVLDVGSTETGAPYLVMEHLVGQDLRKIVRERGPLPVGEAVDYLLQTCDAVAEAHARGIIHRDLKPGNLFVTARPDGAPLVKVLDFGLAKVLEPQDLGAPDESITQTGLVAGSPHYMSPEQFRSLRKADTRSDIWALGVVAYEILAGRRPFLGEGMSGVMMSVVTEQPEPLREIRPDLPAPLAALVMRCLEKSPDRRPQTVTEIIAALKALSAPAPQDSANTSSASWDPTSADVLPPAPGRSTWRMIDPGTVAAAQAYAGATATETSKGVSLDPAEAWADVIEARRTARDRTTRRRWLVFGSAVAVGLSAAVAVRMLVKGPEAGAAGDPAAPESDPLVPATNAPPGTVQAVPAPAPEPAEPPPAMSGQAAPPATGAPGATASTSSTSAKQAGSTPSPAPSSRPKAARPGAPGAASKPDDPFGKYD